MMQLKSNDTCSAQSILYCRVVIGEGNVIDCDIVFSKI